MVRTIVPSLNLSLVGFLLEAEVGIRIFDWCPQSATSIVISPRYSARGEPEKTSATACGEPRRGVAECGVDPSTP